MLKKALFILIIVVVFPLGLCLSCDDGSLIFMNELSDIIHGGGGGSGTNTITVKADSVGKAYRSGVPFPDPELTYTYEPNPLPDGVSLTGELERDPGELVGTYVIRRGTLELTGENASKYTLKFIGNVFYISD